MNENKRNEAKELIKKGKWNLAVALIAKETGLPEDEAKKVATQIKEEWLAERAAEPAPETKKKGVGGKIIVVLFLLAVFGGGGWFAYNHFVVEPAQYAIEEDEDDMNIETKAVGNCDDSSVLNLAENTDGHYFVYNKSELTLYRVSLESLDEEISTYNESEPAQVSDAKKASINAAKSTKEMLDSNFYDYSLDMTPTGVGMPEDITIDGHTYKNQLYEKESGNSIDGDMYEYFKSRDIQISCNNIKVDKIVFDTSGEFHITLDAEITTNHCDKESVFPPEGKTDNMIVEVDGPSDSVVGFAAWHILIK